MWSHGIYGLITHLMRIMWIAVFRLGSAHALLSRLQGQPDTEIAAYGRDRDWKEGLVRNFEMRCQLFEDLGWAVDVLSGYQPIIRLFVPFLEHALGRYPPSERVRKASFAGNDHGYHAAIRGAHAMADLGVDGGLGLVREGAPPHREGKQLGLRRDGRDDRAVGARGGSAAEKP